MKRNREYYVGEKWEIHWVRARRGSGEGRTVRDIADYEIGSGYGPLNDVENVASRRRRRCNDGRLFAKDKKVCLYFEDHESGTSQRLLFSLSFLSPPPPSFLSFSFVPFLSRLPSVYTL